MRSILSLPLPWKQRWLAGVRPPHEVRDNLRLRDGTAVTLRGAHANDGALIQSLVQGLSTTSRYQRFFYPLHEVPPGLLALFTHNAPAKAMTILAVIRHHGQEVPVAMAQYVADPYPARADFAVVVADQWQRFGLGKRLIQSLVCLARAAGIQRLEGDVLAENEAMTRLVIAMGFRVMQHEDGAYLRRVSKALDAPERCSSPLTELVLQSA